MARCGFSLAPTNVYYRATSLKETGNPDDLDSIYQDPSAQAVMARGGAFMVCHNALTVVAGLVGPKAGVNLMTPSTTSRATSCRASKSFRRVSRQRSSRWSTAGTTIRCFKKRRVLEFSARYH